ncbi:MAG: hypothetical protein K8T25_18415 [Planctomycetia bacterium]|nr:hypothetical protein [Planctomycetia bacterium]
MAKNISCTVDVRCWKQRTCTACGGVFSYIFARKIAGMGPTREAAAAAMEANAVKQVMTDASSHPCPTCGLYQPDMVAARRVTAQGWLFAVSIPAMLLLLILNVSNTVQDNLIVPAAAGIMVVVGLLQLVFDARRPNRDLEANRQLAQRSIERQLLRVDTPGRAQQGMEVPWSTQGSMGSLNAMGAPSVAGVSSSTGGGVVPLALFVIGLTAVLVPPIVRESRGWPFNPVAFPPIVGPGDSTRFYTQHSLRSIDGKFRAEADAVATPKGGGAEFPLVAKSNQDNWGDSTIR